MKKFLSMALVLLMLVGVLTACAVEAPQTPVETAPAPESEADSTETTPETVDPVITVGTEAENTEGETGEVSVRYANISGMLVRMDFSNGRLDSFYQLNDLTLQKSEEQQLNVEFQYKSDSLDAIYMYRQLNKVTKANGAYTWGTDLETFTMEFYADGMLKRFAMATTEEKPQTYSFEMDESGKVVKETTSTSLAPGVFSRDRKSVV